MINNRKSVQVSVKKIVTLKKKVRKPSIAKNKDTVCKFINLDVPPTTCNLIKQPRKFYRWIAEIDPDSVEKFRISKVHEINAVSKEETIAEL